MENVLTKWMKRRKEDRPTITLDDVTPMHPDEYPARGLKQRLDARRDAMSDIEDSHMGMPEGPGGF